MQAFGAEGKFNAKQIEDYKRRSFCDGRYSMRSTKAMVHFLEEVGELTKLMRRSDRVTSEISSEIGDCVWFVFDVAASMSINVDLAVSYKVSQFQSDPWDMVLELNQTASDIVTRRRFPYKKDTVYQDSNLSVAFGLLCGIAKSQKIDMTDVFNMNIKKIIDRKRAKKPFGSQRPFVDCEKRFAVFGFDIGGGKSEALNIIAFNEMAKERRKVAHYSNDPGHAARTFFQSFDPAEASFSASQLTVRKNESGIRFFNIDSIINIESPPSLDLLLIDEVQFAPDLQALSSLYDSAAKIRVTVGSRSPFNRTVCDAYKEDGDLGIFPSTIDDNPKIDASYKERIKKHYDIDAVSK